MADGLPRTRRRSIHASRNLSRALRRHCVIGCADPGQNPSAVRSGSSRVRGGVWAGQRRGRCHRAGLVSALTPRTLWSTSGTPRGDASPASRPCRASRLASPDMAPRTQRWQQWKGGKRGGKNCRSLACLVNRFVNRTLRDSARRGRGSRRSEMGSVLSVEVAAPARDGLRR
jgi:hypothetical protein